MSKIKTPIFMDYQSTTPVDPRVLEAMLPCFTEQFGNAASRNHPFGWDAEKLVNHGRAQIAEMIHASAKEIVFTSGATESNNIAIKGAFEIYKQKGNHIITQVTEHKAVLDTCHYLETLGAKVTYLPVDHHGRISLDDLNKAITPKTILVSIMYANNEIGTLQPIAEIGHIAKIEHVLFHVDAAQAAGRIPIDVEKLGIDLMSISAHKMYGPKGIGVLYVREKNPHVRVAPVIHGGGHERGMRSGTLNVPSIVGFGKACEIAKKEMKAESERLTKLRDHLLEGIKKNLDEVQLNGHPSERLCNNLNLSFRYAESESLMKALCAEVAVSSGSACSTGNPEPSHVLKALNIPEDRVQSSIRFGLGRYTTEEEIDFVIERVTKLVTLLRKVSPLYAAHKAVKS